jgi:cell pole-organizing protein PopZ
MGEIQQDPSMEEILASIKRVIAEDGRAAVASQRPQRRSPRAELPPAPADEDEYEQDVLELEDPVSEGEGLLSADAAAASRQKLAALSALHGRGESAPAPGGDGALEAVVREMLRPMLKEWLDQHLPELVEELVTREIARITGKSV